MNRAQESSPRIYALLENDSLHYGAVTIGTDNRITIIAHRTLGVSNVIHQGIVYNQTAVVNALQEFINTYRISHQSLWLCVSGLGASETTIWHPHAHAHKTDLWHVGLSLHAWDIAHLYPAHDNGFILYVGGIRREIILQWQIISMRLSLSLACVTTPFYALWNMYKGVFASAYRSSQLAADMSLVGLSLEKAVSSDALNRLFRSGAHYLSAHELLPRALIAGMGIAAHRN